LNTQSKQKESKAHGEIVRIKYSNHWNLAGICLDKVWVVAEGMHDLYLE